MAGVDMKELPPAVTVIIPSYNCAAFVGEAVESVLQQTVQDFEIVIVDDGSTDDTRSLLGRFSTESRIRYVYEQNRGLPAARNRGVEEAHGEFIAALDADDTLAQNALEVMISTLRNSTASWCVIDITKFWEGYSRQQATEMPDGDLLAGILRDDFIRRAMFFRRDALLRVGGWDETMKNREDWDLNIRLIQAREPFVYIPLPLYRYRKRPDSITTGNPRKILEYTEKLLRKHHKQLIESGHKYVTDLYASNFWDLARRYYYELGDKTAAAHCAVESIRYRRNFWRLARAVHRVALTSLTSRGTRNADGGPRDAGARSLGSPGASTMRENSANRGTPTISTAELTNRP